MYEQTTFPVVRRVPVLGCCPSHPQRQLWWRRPERTLERAVLAFRPAVDFDDGICGHICCPFGEETHPPDGVDQLLWVDIPNRRRKLDHPVASEGDHPLAGVYQDSQMRSFGLLLLLLLLGDCS